MRAGWQGGRGQQGRVRTRKASDGIPQMQWVRHGTGKGWGGNEVVSLKREPFGTERARVVECSRQTRKPI